MRRIPFEYAPGPEHFGLHRVFAPLAPNPKVDLVHLWNRVSIGRAPWGVSFEDTLPYLNPRIHARAIRFQRRRLLSGQCRFIIGVSEYAVRRFQETLSGDEWSQLSKKTHQVYPNHPKPVRTHPHPALGAEDALRLVFVGGDFFRKGGEIALRAIEEVGEDLNLRLTVISRVEGNDYSGTPPKDVDVAEVRTRLKDNPRIQWVQRLQHEEVMAIIQQHHLGLLPTLSDTFGYSVLEFMSLGVPSIVSNVQALPEFTGADTGWQFDVSTDEQGIWLGRHPDLDKRRFHYFDSVEHATTQCTQILAKIRANPAQLRAKSTTSEARFDQQFNPIHRADQVRQIYIGAVK